MGKRLKKIDRKLKYEGHRVKVYEDTILTPDGETLYYDYVENRNGAAVLLVDEDERLVFVKLYRQALDGDSVEIPGGCMEPSDVTLSEDILTKAEAPEDMEAFISCAKREAEEETGLIPGKLTFINYIVASVGLFSERTAVFIGTDCTAGSVKRDSDEYMDVIRLTVDEAVDYINKGLIHDSKTILAVYAYIAMRERLGE
ncbi:MAG: NUDIX hydrolase [Eubacterium sp.]|nr:NUDIX hydrolase [Eubacterium sp.]